MTPEGKVAKRVKTVSKMLGLRAKRNHAGPGAEAGWPDYFVFGPNKNLLGVETKSLGKDATPLQKERGREMCAYGFGWCKPDKVEDVDFTLFNFALYCIGEETWSRARFDREKPLRKM